MRQLERDGVALCYEEAGEGEPPDLLVHGWCCDHTYFAPQFEHFAERGHRVVAVDLRGHGKSDKPHQRYAMQDFADDLAWVCQRLELAKPVVIGHSMGGIVAFDLAARYPHLPSAVVMLDAAVFLPSAARAAIPGLLEQLRGPDYQNVLREYASKSLFIPTDDLSSARSAYYKACPPRLNTWWCRHSRACATTTPQKRPEGLRYRAST